MKVLVVNAGSSSLKYKLINMNGESVLAKGIVERIGFDGTVLKHEGKDGQKIEIDKEMKDHTDAFKLVVEALTDSNYGVIKSMDEIKAVGHRVLHGGEKYAGSFIINDDVIAAIEECAVFGPLHNPANLMGIRACQKIMPNVPMVAVFDTAFHQTMPKKAYIYGLPYEAYSEMKIRRYGFHGTSHAYVSKRAAEMVGKKPEEVKIVSCHLGNGASIAAVDHGKCVDTSMGLTPLEGLIMGTRCGSIDPAIVEFLMKEKGMTINEVTNYMNKQSGVYGISGISSDFRDIWKAWDTEKNERAKLALDAFCYNVKKYIGAYAAAMGGIDVIAITAGIGENDPRIRKMIIEGLEFLGAVMDDEKNSVRGQESILSADDSKVKIVCVSTDEELKIAQETKALCL